MRQELDDALCAKYPAIFAERNASPQESSMHWGFACGDGWYALIDTLCGKLQHETDHNGAPQVVARQVKEKFGRLRFYVNQAGERQRGMIDLACAVSVWTREESE